MSREYTIKLSENEIRNLMTCMKLSGHHEQPECFMKDEKVLYDKLQQAKQKPYTNFDMIKDEMTIDDLLKAKEGCKWNDIFKRRCKTIRCDMGGCEDCKRWLEREVVAQEIKAIEEK